MFMFSQFNWGKPQTASSSLLRGINDSREGDFNIVFRRFNSVVRPNCFSVPWTPVPYTFQTFAVLATGVYLRRNDAFVSGCLYLVVGALGAPVFAEGAQLFDSGKLIASGGYLMAFPFASALVAEGLDRSRSAGVADVKAQLICWTLAMIPVYAIGTLWLAESYSVDFAQAMNGALNLSWFGI